MSIHLDEEPRYGLPRVRRADGSLEHVYCEGSRQHVLWYSTLLGTHCSEPECEINRAPNPQPRGSE